MTKPMICRLWGLTRMMACPHGCVPSRWLTEEEARGFLDNALALSDGKDVRISIEDPQEALAHASDVQERRAMQEFIAP